MTPRLAALITSAALVASACGSASNTSESIDSTSGVPVSTAPSATSSTAETAASPTTEPPSTNAPATASTAETVATVPTAPAETIAAPIGDANERLLGQFATLSGTNIDLTDFHNQDVVLWMWAPW